MLYEPRPLITLHSDDLAHIQIIGENVHFALSVTQPSVVHAGHTDFMINHRHSMPVVGVMRALPLVISKLAAISAFSTSEMMLHLLNGGSSH